jgi:membrane-bound lytic murein transglycosylase D
MGRDLLRGKALALALLVLPTFALAPPCFADTGGQTGAEHTPDSDAGAAADSTVPGRALRSVPPAEAPGEPDDARSGDNPVPHPRWAEPEFGLPMPEHPSIDSWIERYRAFRKEELVETLARGRMFRRFVTGELRDRGLPQELQYLPVLESHYRVRAVSRSGAAGIWQIMANTAAPLGLRRNLWLDERRDFWLATSAALRKLEENYLRFGSWPLALAAYNCGSGCLIRAIRAGGTADFWELCSRGLLPRETVEYVPKFYALVRLCAYPVRWGLAEAADPEPAAVWVRIQLDRSVELARVAELAGIPAEVLSTANAELSFGITPPPGAVYALKVPADREAEVRALLADPDAELLRYQVHTVRTGDTFYALARHYGVAAELIQSSNPGVDPRGLRIGAALKVPVIGGRLREPPAPVPDDTAFTGLYSVATGDTLWSISRRFGTTPERLAAANRRGLDDPLRPGETLSVPGGE